MSRWRPIEGFEGEYEVSYDGIVRSLDRVIKLKSRWGTPMERKAKGQQIKSHLNKKTGYYQVGLKRNDKIFNRTVHQLVAAAFLPPKPEWADRVNHKDSNRWHNVVSNLEWSNASLNALHYFDQPHAKTWSRQPCVDL